MEFAPADKTAPMGESGGWIGRYPFGGGVFYGCYDAASRAFAGVWTQATLSTPCADERFGQAIWGEVRFEFDETLHRFEGWYNFCGEPERYGWNGELDPTLKPVDGGEIMGAPSCPPGLISRAQTVDFGPPSAL